MFNSIESEDNCIKSEDNCIECEDNCIQIDLNKASKETNESIKSTNDSNIDSYPKVLEPKKCDIQSYFETLGSSKPTNSQIKTQEINKKPTFIMTKTQCIIKPLNSFIRSEKDGSKSSDNLIKIMLLTPHKKEVVNCVKVSHSFVRSQAINSPQKMRLWVPQRPQSSVYKLVQISHTNTKPVKLESDEPESDLIFDDEYFKYLGLIGSKKLDSLQINSLNRWPLRTIARVNSSPKRNIDGDIILNDIYQKPMTMTETESTSNSNEANCEVSRKKLAKQKWLNEVRDNTQRLVQQKQIEKVKDDNYRKREKELRESKKEALHLASSFDISSFMGKRVFRSLFKALDDLDKYLLTVKCENNCFDELVDYLSATNMSFNNLSANSVSRITRNSNNCDWNPRRNQHTYCFNKRERLEKWKTLETGLDWRSRLLKSQCKRVFIKMFRVIKCPLCSQTIDSEHQCSESEFDYDFSYNCNDSQTSCVKQNDSNDEIVIIEEHLNNNQLKCEDHFVVNNKNCCDSHMKSNEEDDDVIFIEEVNQTTKNVLKLKQMFIESKPVFSSSDSLQTMQFFKSRTLQTSNDLKNSIHLIEN